MLKLKAESFKTPAELATFLKKLLQKQDQKLVMEAFEIYKKSYNIDKKIREKNIE